LRWITGRHGWVLPWVVFALALTVTAVIDRQWVNQRQADRRDRESRALEQLSIVADALGNVVAERMGALAVPKLRFTPMADSVSERTFAAAVDSVTVDLAGLQAISVVNVEGGIDRDTEAVLGRAGLEPAADSAVRAPFLKALATRQPAATGVLQGFGTRRVIVFDPVLEGPAGPPVAVLAAELDPLTLYQVAVGMLPDSVRRGFSGGFSSLHGPGGVQITTPPAPVGWLTTDRPVRVADTEWTVRLTYPPEDESAYTGMRLATWLAGLVMAAAFAAVLAILRGTVRRQGDEIARREEAERRARQAAEESSGLSAQLAAAHTAAQSLSTSLDPSYVLEYFLGTVGEVLHADTASVYTFDEEGDLVGRSRLVLRDAGPEVARLKGEDIREVRVPAALLPQLAETAATGEPQVVEDAMALREATGLPGGVDTAAAWVTIPLKVGGNMVGLALWEVFREPRTFDAKDVAFAEALGAQAAATLRTAELYASLETASGLATWEASRFGAVLDQMEDGVLVIDADGEVERYNRAVEELMGTPPESGLLLDWIKQLDLTTLDRRRIAGDEFPALRALRGEIIRRVDMIARRAGREERYLSVSAMPILSQRGQSGAAMLVRDNTDEQQYAEMLRHTNQELRNHTTLLEERNEQLRAATTAKDQFLAVVSHELRTPVNAIMGYGEILDLEIKGTLNADQKTMMKRIRATAWHLLGLIDEILDLPKVASGEIELNLEPVDLEEVLTEAVDQVAPIAGSKGLDLTVVHGRGRGGEKLLANADHKRLKQVVLNLLSNAIKFTDQGGVTLKSAQDGDGFVEVRVSDTGPGISEDQQERIFEEFYQVEGGLTRKAGGTGLGLAITRRFVRLMGGDVTVDSRLGQGSEFVVRVPAAQS
jgi:PAS domain S-box-containing protein